MNPVILGAIIGAVPGTLAAGLSTWAAVRAGKVNLAQTQLALSTEHYQWLRDKRSEIYVDLLRHARRLYLRRRTIVESLSDITDADHYIRDADRREVESILDEYKKSDTQDLIARARAFAPTDTAQIFGQLVCLTDFAFWRFMSIQMKQLPRFKMLKDTKWLLDMANEGMAVFGALASRDLQTAPSPSAVTQAATDETDIFSRLHDLTEGAAFRASL